MLVVRGNEVGVGGRLVVVFLLYLSIGKVSRVPFSNDSDCTAPPVKFKRDRFRGPLVGDVGERPCDTASVSFPARARTLRMGHSSSSQCRSLGKA